MGNRVQSSIIHAFHKPILNTGISDIAFLLFINIFLFCISIKDWKVFSVKFPMDMYKIFIEIVILKKILPHIKTVPKNTNDFWTKSPLNKKALWYPFIQWLMFYTLFSTNITPYVFQISFIKMYLFDMNFNSIGHDVPV